MKILYKGDPQGYWAQQKHKQWIKERLLDSYAEVTAAMLGYCGNDDKQSMARTFFSEMSGIKDARDMRKIFAGDRIKLISNRGRIIQVNDLPMRQKILSSKIDELGILDEFEVVKATDIPGKGRMAELVRKGSKEAERSTIEPFTKPLSYKAAPRTPEEKQIEKKLRIARGEAEPPKQKDIWIPHGPKVKPETIIEPMSLEDIQRALGGKGFVS